MRRSPVKPVVSVTGVGEGIVAAKVVARLGVLHPMEKKGINKKRKVCLIKKTCSRVSLIIIVIGSN